MQIAPPDENHQFCYTFGHNYGQYNCFEWKYFESLLLSQNPINVHQNHNFFDTARHRVKCSQPCGNITLML